MFFRVCRSAKLSVPILAVALGALALAPPAAAQDTVDLGVTRSGARRIRVEVMPLQVGSSRAEVRAGATQLADRLVRDLIYSGHVATKDPLPQGVRFPRYGPSSARFADTPADHSLELELQEEGGGRLAWVARMRDPSGLQILGKRYTVNLADPSQTVHHLADEIVHALTGDQGIAQTRIIFSRGSNAQRELFMVDYDGENVKQVTRNGSLNLAPRWSPRGDRVCYTSYHRGRQRLLVLDGSTGKSANVAEFDGLNIGASWHPDGKELVVTLSRDGDPEIYRMTPSGTIVQQLTFHDAIDCSPYFDPTGRQVVYTSDRTGVPQIYVMDREGANRRRLTYEGRYNDSAAWSPKSSQIAYVSRREGRFQIFTIEPDGSNLQEITVSGDGNNEDPSWASDGRHLVVSSDRTGATLLWILDTETGVARPLTFGEGSDTTPHWSGSPPASSASGR